ncbi:MAG: sigma-54-dependent Fis family transcriptional regulator [Acidobacteriota bacterium]
MTRELPLALIVDDDPYSLSALEAMVRAEGFESTTAETVAAARDALGARIPDVLLVDYRLPDGAGTELAPQAALAQVEFILVTGEATVETVVEALRAGASDVLTKPVDPARLKALLDGLARSGSYRREIHGLREELRSYGRFGSMIGASPPMQAVYDRIARGAPTEATILVTGESGTGKELVAETVHRLSRRAHRPFVAVNCGAIAANLIESELFGHERGAFTGADRLRKGVFERADHGTLFLDEISEMPIELQVKLLRVLESGVFSRVGGERASRTDVRVVAASNRDLEAAVAEGRFRADLLYRLRVIEIALPPLRERGSDLETLALHFLAEQNLAAGQERRFRPEVLETLAAHPFPGNVRELRNLIHQAWILADREIGLEHLPAELVAGRRGAPASRGEASGDAADPRRIVIDIPSSLAEIERAAIEATLEHVGGDKRRAATLLGVSLKTIYSRLREYAVRRSA